MGAIQCLDDNDILEEIEAEFLDCAPVLFFDMLKNSCDAISATLGNILGVLKQYVSDMEHGRRTISKEMAKKIASALGYPVTLFI